MTKEFANSYVSSDTQTNYNTISFARITDFIIIVLVFGIASFVWSYRRSLNFTIALITGILFMLFASILMYSVNLRLSQKKEKKVINLANRLYLQAHIANCTNEQYGNMLVSLLEAKSFKCMPETGAGFRLGKDRRFYLLYPMRRYGDYKLSGQDVMYVCDIARRKNYKRVIIAASCDIDPLAIEFAQVVENIEVILLDMDNINNMYMETFEDIPDIDIEKHMQSAKIKINQSIKSRRSIVKMFPAIRYLLCGIMLLITSAFMPFDTFYIISGGICLAIFVLLVFFPNLRKASKTSKQ